MKRHWMPLIVLAGIFLFGCRFFYVSVPRSADPSEGVEITIDLMPDADLTDNSVFRPVVCLGMPSSWTISEVSYSGMINSTVEIFGFPAYSSSNSSVMNTNLPLSYSGEPGDWHCYIGQEAAWTSDAYGSVTFHAADVSAGAFTLYISAGVDDPYGPGWSTIEKRVGVGDPLPDHELWVKANVDAEEDSFLYGVAHGGGNYVAVGRKLDPGYPSGWAPLVLHSDDARNWTRVLSAGNRWFEDVHYADGRFVAAGELGLVTTSATGESWEIANPEGGWWIDSVTYGNGTWVGVGGQSAYWATDINSWSVTTVPGAFDLHGVTHGEGLFVAVGGWTEAKAKIFTSEDGMDWSLVESSTTGTLFDIAYGDGRFVAVGDSNIYYSDDLVVWTLTPNPAGAQLTSVAWLDGRFTATATDGSIFLSADGAQWTEITSGTSLSIADITEDGNRFIAVGDYGLIMLSTTSSGGGGGGGCNTAGPAPGEPVWPEMMWFALLAGLLVWRRKRAVRQKV